MLTQSQCIVLCMVEHGNRISQSQAAGNCTARCVCMRAYTITTMHLFVLCMVEHGNCTAVRCICERMFTCVIAYACLHDHDAFVLCMAEHGNRISQSQAAAWWDAVVRVKAAKHGKATKV